MNHFFIVRFISFMKIWNKYVLSGDLKNRIFLPWVLSFLLTRNVMICLLKLWLASLVFSGFCRKSQLARYHCYSSLGGDKFALLPRSHILLQSFVWKVMPWILCWNNNTTDVWKKTLPKMWSFVWEILPWVLGKCCSIYGCLLSEVSCFANYFAFFSQTCLRRSLILTLPSTQLRLRKYERRR